jgi:hypothetical protein
MVDVLETVRGVFEPLRDIDPNYAFVGEENPWVEVYDWPEGSRPPIPLGGGFFIRRGAKRPEPRLEQRHGYRVTLTIFDTSVSAECEEFGSTTSQIAMLIDSIMEYLPENLAWKGHDSAWPGCLPGHGHPPEVGPRRDVGLAWLCPNTGEIAHEIALVP